MSNFTHTLKTALLSAAAFALTPLSAIAQDSFAITNATVVTNEGTGPVSGMTVIIENGKIKAIGKTDSSDNAPTPNGTSILDGTGQWITPGLFAPFARIGMVEISLEDDTNDSRASKSKSSVSLKAADSFNPISTIVAVTRAEGVTFAAIAPAPSSSIFGGTGAVVDTSSSLDGSVLNSTAFVYAELGEAGASRSGGSRSAAIAQLKDALNDAAAYPGRYKSPTDGDALSRADAAALAPAAQGKIPLIIKAERASDLKAVINLKRSYPKLNIIIIGAAEGWMVADQLSAARIAVMIDPVESLPYGFEAIGSRLDNAALLHEAGVKIAIMSRTSDFSHNVRLLPQHAGNAVAYGLPWTEAFKAVTLTPATMFGRADLGTLKAGSEANLVIWDGDPLEVSSAPVRIVLDGQTQSLESRQSKLAQRYNPNRDDSRPYGYR